MLNKQGLGSSVVTVAKIFFALFQLLKLSRAFFYCNIAEHIYPANYGFPPIPDQRSTLDRTSDDRCESLSIGF